MLAGSDTTKTSQLKINVNTTQLRWAKENTAGGRSHAIISYCSEVRINYFEYCIGIKIKHWFIVSCCNQAMCVLVDRDFHILHKNIKTTH